MAIDKRINYIGGGEVTDTYQGGSGAVLKQVRLLEV